MVSENLQKTIALFLTILAILSIPILLFTFLLIIMLELSLFPKLDKLFEPRNVATVVGLTILDGVLFYTIIKVIRWVRS